MNESSSTGGTGQSIKRPGGPVSEVAEAVDHGEDE